MADSLDFGVRISLILDDIEDQEFDTIPWHLHQLNYHPGSVIPNLSSLFDQHKPEILKEILKAIKDPEIVGIEPEDLEGMIDSLKLLGVRWPEIAIIEKSLNAGLSRLYESFSDTEWRRSHKLAVFFSSADLFPEEYTLNDPDADIRQHLVAIKDSILRSIDSELKFWERNGASVTKLLSFMAAIKWGMKGELWPELNAILEKNRQLIIKTLLVMIKEYLTVDFDVTVYWGKPDAVIEDATYLKPEWPELKAIAKSLPDSNEQLNEVSVPPYYIDMFREFDRNAYYNYDHGWRVHRDLKTYTDIVVRWVDKLWKTERFLSDNPAYYAVKTLISGDDRDYWISVFRPVMDNHKTDIMTYLLQQIKRGAFYYAARDMQPFLKLGIDWPEFLLLKDWLYQNGNDNVKQRLTKLDESWHLENIIQSFDRLDPVDLICQIAKNLKYGQINLEDVKPLIEQNKDRLIKGILAEARYGEADLAYYAAGMLTSQMGIEWPELKTIQLSLSKDIDTQDH